MDGANPLTGAVEVGTGPEFTCAHLESGIIKCWGANGHGNLAQGDQVASLSPVAVKNSDGTAPLDDIKLWSQNMRGGCVVLNDDSIQCWGWGLMKGSGPAPYNNVTLPEQVVGVNDPIDIGTGYSHGCAVEAAGTIKCWGYNQFGKLGNGTLDPASYAAPSTVVGIDDAIAVSADNNHTCALTRSGTVKCWGKASMLGDGSTEDRLSAGPTVPGIEKVVSLRVTAYVKTCVINESGEVWCWENNTLPKKLPISDIIAFAPTQFGGFYMQSDGTILSHGYNDKGQLGSGVVEQIDWANVDWNTFYDTFYEVATTIPVAHRTNCTEAKAQLP